MVEELGVLPGFRVGRLGPVFISVFDKTATLERLELLEKLQAEFIKQHPAMFALNVVVGTALSQPEAAVRVKSAELQKRFDTSTKAAVTVLAVRGLGATIARGFLAMLALTASGSKPTEVFKTVEEAAAWLKALPGAPAEVQRLDAAAISTFVAGVR